MDSAVLAAACTGRIEISQGLHPSSTHGSADAHHTQYSRRSTLAATAVLTAQQQYSLAERSLGRRGAKILDAWVRDQVTASAPIKVPWSADTGQLLPHTAQPSAVWC